MCQVGENPSEALAEKGGLCQLHKIDIFYALSIIHGMRKM